MDPNQNNNTGNLAGVYLPASAMPDTSAFEPSAPTSQIGGLALSAQEGFASAPVADLATHLKSFLTQEFSPGKMLSADAYKTSPYFREGLNFPSGVSENVARLRANEYDQNVSVNSVLDNMPAGLVSGTTKFVGSTIGMALDPVNLATGYGVEATIGTKSASLLSTLAAKPALQRAATVGVGAAEGAAITTPQALSQYDAADQLGEDPSVASIFATMGMGAGLGGLIKGLVGVREPITLEADQMAKQVAVNQMATGKSVHVDEILQNGYNEARNAEPTINPDDLLKNENDLNAQLSTTTQSIADEQKNLDDLLFKQKAQETVTPPTANSSPNLYSRILSVFQKAPATRDASDISFLNTLPKTEEVNNLVQAVQKPLHLQDASDRNLMGAFQQDQESDLIKSRLAKQDSEIAQLNDTLASTSKKNTKAIKDLNDQVKDLQIRRSAGQSRLEELQNLNDEPSAISKSRKRVNDLHVQKANLENEILKNRTMMAMTKDAMPALESSQIKNSSDYMRSYKSDSSYSEAKEQQLTDELKGIPDDPYKDIKDEEEQVKSLEKKDMLDEEDKENLETVRKYDSQMTIFSKALKNTINCMKEG